MVSKTVSIPIVWAMGAQAQTWVLKRNGNLYESRVSYYPSIKGLAITTGDERLTPKTIDEAVGRPIGMDEAKACFNCHSTNALVDHNLNLKGLHPGVTCERCHAGVHAHAAGMLAGSASAPIPQSLGKLPAEDISNFCGQCHRSWETVVRGHWSGPADVRFQPYRLANSRCFNGADPRISCVACHDPHQQVVRDISYYDAKCLACHGQPSAAIDASPSHPKACPVAKSRCASCHMPQVSLPNGLLRFTDHQIRVVKAENPSQLKRIFDRREISWSGRPFALLLRRDPCHDLPFLCAILRPMETVVNIRQFYMRLQPIRVGSCDILKTPYSFFIVA